MSKPLNVLRLVYLLAFASMGCFAPYATLYLGKRGLTPHEIAWMMSMVPLARVFMPPFWGWVADRTGSPVLVFRFLGVAAAGVTGCYFLVEGFHQILAVLLAQSVFHASLFPMLDACSLSLLKEHGGSYGEVRSLGSLGFLTGVSVGGFLWQGEGLWFAPAGMSLLSLASFLAASLLPRTRTVEGEPARLAHLAELLRLTPLVTLYAACFLHEMVICGYDLYFAVHLEALGLSTRVTGIAWATGVAAEVFLLRRSQRLLDQLGPRRLMLLGISLGALRWALNSWVQSPWLLVPLQALHACTFGAWFLGSITLVDRLAPARLRASAQGLFFASLFGLGVSAGARLWGNLQAGYGTATAFRAMALAELLPLLAVYFLVHDPASGETSPSGTPAP